ncbi:OmpA family protein [Pseudodonghicola xiamenensis]|uniref:Membrane protein n=1 Tax=Pseudodonghicola xiamenensis TaxID=337702 RepID=A0A8J3H6E7_9RHOB|nr:OmpA family protein [Pseudodonghicola xiamenensis]GHG84620.1 membrane protein [Pseudodonghicola xiamenensis]
MRLSTLLPAGATFGVAAILCLVAAGFAVSAIEDTTEIEVRRTLDQSGFPWAEVQANGLRVILTGTAPDEAARFAAISAIGRRIDAARVIDHMQITPTADLAPPRFSIELLRNGSGISVIGLIPASTDRNDMVDDLEALAPGKKITDLLESADYPAPDGWEPAMLYAMNALKNLPRAKVSVSAGQVEITAIADSRDAKKSLEAQLTRAAPPGLRLALDIAAPRPVITPFSLRYVIDETGGHFDACSAEDEEARDRILATARAAGLTAEASCTIGLGVPSPNWARAAELSIAALSDLGGGSVTFADADITLIAAKGTDAGHFDHVIGELETALPEVFALHSVLPPAAADAVDGPPEFVATLSPEGQVQLRGRLSDETLRQMADSYAKARFGSNNVHTAARLVEGLPGDWPVRVLAGLDALSQLVNGAVTVTPDTLALRGISYDEDAKANISRLLSDKLGEAANFTLDITYRVPPPPADAPPDPEQCEARLSEAQKGGKITFEPGSATIAAASRPILDKISEILSDCEGVRLEIQGHTDSQGREEMNQQLSQARAQSVLNELRARRVLTSSFSAVGYGEANPIASNATEEGREANRRIDFKLIRPKSTENETTTLDSMAGRLPVAAGEEAEPETDPEDIPEGSGEAMEDLSHQNPPEDMPEDMPNGSDDGTTATDDATAAGGEDSQ